MPVKHIISNDILNISKEENNMEDDVKRSGLLTASKVLGIIQTVGFGLSLVMMLLALIVGIAYGEMVSFFTSMFIWVLVVFVINVLSVVYAHKAQKTWCKEYATIAGGLFIVNSVLTLSLFSILCACFCMSERNKLYQTNRISVKKPIIIWSILGGISVIILISGFIFGIFEMNKSLTDFNKSCSPGTYEDYEDEDTCEPDGDDKLILHKNEESKLNSSTPKEYLDALQDATIYAIEMHYSEKAIFNQLTAEYGEGYSAEAAQYAIDNLYGVDYKENALHQAKDYYYKMSMTKENVKKTLEDEVIGDGFTQEEVEYAMENLEK